MIGLEIGSYKLTTKIGEGGMGEVYIAEHKLLKRKAAVKLLLKELNSDANIVRRFINEAKATSQIDHPGIVQILDFGNTTEGNTYMVMEFLEGETLSSRGRKLRRFPIDHAVSIARQMADALSAAHAHGVVHRDLKPDNVFLVPDKAYPFGDKVKILDFGIAKMLDPTMGAPQTRTGSIMGTPVYMSPEQCRAAPKIDHRADLYALGCVLFHLICGRPPFDLSGIGELLGAHVYTPPPKPSSLMATISPQLDAIILKLLAKKPEERFLSMKELIAAFDGAPILHHSEPSDSTVGIGEVPASLMGEGDNVNTIVDGGPPGALSTVADTPRGRSDGPSSSVEVSDQRGEPASTPKTMLLPPEMDGPRPIMPPAQQAPTPSRKEITTLGGSSGESRPRVKAVEAPDPRGKRGSPMGALAVTFGLTITLALGGVYFAFFRNKNTRTLPISTPTATSVTVVIESDPPGADVYGDDNARAGMTPFELKLPMGLGLKHYVLKMDGYDDVSISVPMDHDDKKHITLAPKPIQK